MYITYAASNGLRRFAFRKRQMFPAATRILRAIFPQRYFGFLGRTALPRSALASAKPRRTLGTISLHSFLARFVLLPVMVTRALGHRYTFAELGQSVAFWTVTALHAIRFARVYGGNVFARPLARIAAGGVMLTSWTLYAYEYVCNIQSATRLNLSFFLGGGWETG